MKIEKKIEVVERLEKELSGSKGFWFTDFTGLPVGAMVQLRRDLRGSSLVYQVMKKSVAERVLEKMEIELSDEWMEGPLGVCMGDDLVSGSRILIEFQKKQINFKIKGCWFDGNEFSRDEIRAIAALPGREALIAKLVCTMNSPVYGFVQVLQSLLTNLAHVLGQVRDKRETEEKEKEDKDGDKSEPKS
jgi:large subunit ribosomal protein L10